MLVDHLERRTCELAYLECRKTALNCRSNPTVSQRVKARTGWKRGLLTFLILHDGRFDRRADTRSPLSAGVGSPGDAIIRLSGACRPLPCLAVIAGEERRGWELRIRESIEQGNGGGRERDRAGTGLAAQCEGLRAGVECAPWCVCELSRTGAGDDDCFDQVTYAASRGIE